MQIHSWWKGWAVKLAASFLFHLVITIVNKHSAHAQHLKEIYKIPLFLPRHFNCHIFEGTTDVLEVFWLFYDIPAASFERACWTNHQSISHVVFPFFSRRMLLYLITRKIAGHLFSVDFLIAKCYNFLWLHGQNCCLLHAII
jgi:hypothetical protein